MAAEHTIDPVPSPPVAGSLGARVRAMREARGWSLPRLVSESGLAHTTLWSLERCEHRPFASTVERLADAFGLIGLAREEFLAAPAETTRGTALPSRGPFGIALRRYRRRAGQTQTELGRRVGCQASYLGRLESGIRTAPGRPMVERVAVALALSPEDADTLLMAAGHVPAFARDRTIRQVAALLAGDPVLAAAVRAQINALDRMTRDGEGD